MTGRRSLLGLLMIAVLGCGGGPGEPRVRPIDSPAPRGAVFPSIAMHGERLYLSWTEPAAEGAEARVRFAALDGSNWNESETIGSGKLFVNWADFASLAVDADGTIGAHWLVRADTPNWAYGIRFAVRDAEGRWSDPQIPHGRDRAAEHGFVSLIPDDSGRFEMIWLDGRQMEHGGEMELRHTVWADGMMQPQTVLDADVCTCCQTDATAYRDQRFVAYRDHTPGEIRDISYVRFNGTDWSAPVPLSNDGWQIGACPVNGPAVATREETLTVAWFTQADDEPRVLAKRSPDFGATFGELMRIDAGDPIGRVDVAALADGSAAVAWLERAGDEAVVLLRRIGDGDSGSPIELGRTAAHRDSGFPRLATDGRSVWAAWTETSRPTAIRLSRIDW